MQQLSLLMPQEIQIVEAFTKFAALDKSDKVDGIELRLRPLDSFGDPIKIAGIVRAELYHRLPASGKREGMRVCPPWKISLSTEQDERKYWNPLTAMYEIPLKLPGGQPPDGQYVVDVIYTTPLDCRLFDQCELNMPPSG